MMGGAGVPPGLMKNQASPLLRIAMVSLGLAVFAWGLQYKLSLYKSASHGQPISVAKLMQGEQSKRAASIQSFSCTRCSQLRLFNTVAAFRSPIVIQRNRQVDKLVCSSITYIPHLLFFKPPPQSA
jgi:hypothetical protein